MERRHCYRNTGSGQEGMDGAACGQGDEFEGIAVAHGEVMGMEGTSRRDRICRPRGEARNSQSPWGRDRGC